MNTYVILLRGINVGGKNKIPMMQLRELLEELGFKNVLTYIQSGNVVVQSKRSAKKVTQIIEESLPKKFTLDSSIIRVLALTHAQLRTVVDSRPKGFGEQPDTFHSDAIFLIGIDSSQAMPIFNPREGVDKVWPGIGVIYSQRLSAERTKSRLGRIIGTPLYQSMTIRSWSTTTKLLEMLDQIAQKDKSRL